MPNIYDSIQYTNSLQTAVWAVLGAVTKTVPVDTGNMDWNAIVDSGQSISGPPSAPADPYAYAAWLTVDGRQSLVPMTSFAVALLDDGSYAAMRATLGLTIGTHVQAWSAILDGTQQSFLTAHKTKLDHLTVTQAVDLDAIETRVNALDAAIILMGTWNAGAGTFPGGGTAQAGESWIVSTGGVVNGVTFNADDRIIAIVDNASTTTYASNWHKADYTDLVATVAGRTGNVVLTVADLTDMSADGRSLVSAANYAAMRTHLSLVVGTNVQAYSAILAGTTESFTTALKTNIDNSAPAPAGGRLTLTSNTPAPAADATAASTLYYTPDMSGSIGLYTGSSWVVRLFPQISISLSGLTANTNYDVFVYDNAGTVTIDTLTAWTNDTTRATALVLQDGVLVKSGATTRRYVGTIRTTATTGQCEDSKTKRFVWNMYNRRIRELTRIDSGNHTYTTATWRQMNADTANQVEMVIGLSESAVFAACAVSGSSTGSGASYYALTSIGLDSTTGPAASQLIATMYSNGANVPASFFAFHTLYPGLGYHYLAWLEYAAAVGTYTWYKGSSGIKGHIFA